MYREFLDIRRENPGYRNGRSSDFDEVEIRLPEESIRKQASRCMGCGIAFCHGFGCPLSNGIQEFNKAVKEDRLRDAYLVLSQTSPFPEFTSRVCPALCEASCCAGLASDPVSIRQIEYAIIENAFKRGCVEPFIPRYRSGMRVAVIGSGPSGLAAAELLNKMGHEVVVFEKSANPGGLLRYGIPDFKLGKSVIERRLEILRASGVTFECGVEIGSDISAQYLRRKFNALCVCVGTQMPRTLGKDVSGASFGGIHYALDFLSSQIKFNSGEISELQITAKDKNVLIVGGGDTGSDCMGTAFRQGAKSVTQVEIMPEPPECRHSSTPWPMWPYMKRTSSSHLEGGNRLWSVNLKSIEGKSGNVRSATFAHCDWNFDSNGRPSGFTERQNGNFKIEADLILLSMGFVGVKKKGLIEELGIMLTPRSMISAAADFSTNIGGVFAAGDSVSGPSLVVRAIRSGRDMALGVDSYLKKATK